MGMRWWILLALMLAGCATDSEPEEAQYFSNRDTGEITRSDGWVLYPPDAAKPYQIRLPGEWGGLFERLKADRSGKLHIEALFGNTAFPRVTFADGTTRQLTGDCAYGIIKGARRVSVPTGSNHLLMDITLGDPETFPANYLSCDYAPGEGGPKTPPTRVRLEGCFYVREASVPTARLLDLAPLPGPACGLY